MKHQRSTTFAFVVVAAAIAVAPARGQTVQSGPYYVPPSWDRTLSTRTRFTVLSNMASNAVLDRETGLVWERSPRTTRVTWPDAQFHCNDLAVGNRKGWRLPRLAELESLLDFSEASRLPAGHPFAVPRPVGLGPIFWSATAYADNTRAVTAVIVRPTPLDYNVAALDKSERLFVWCVRGGPSANPQ